MKLASKSVGRLVLNNKDFVMARVVAFMLHYYAQLQCHAC